MQGYCVLGSKLGSGDTVAIRQWFLSSECYGLPSDPCSSSAPSPKASGSLLPALPTFAESSFSRPQSLPVDLVLLQQTGPWLAVPEVIKVSCSVSGETLSIAIHRQVGATFIQSEKGTSLLNCQVVTAFLDLCLHQAKTT